MTKRVTKAQILREARRVYGVDVHLTLSPRGYGWHVDLYARGIREQMLYMRAANEGEARRMVWAALQAAGSAR